MNRCFPFQSVLIDPSTQLSDYNLFCTRIANTAYILWTLGLWFSYNKKILNNCLFTFKWIKIQLTMSKEPHIFFLAVQEAPRGSTARYEMNCAYSLKTTTVSPSSDDVCLVSEVMIPVRTRPSEWHVYHCLRSFSRTCSSLSPANIVCNGSLMTVSNSFGSFIWILDKEITWMTGDDLTM